MQRLLLVVEGRDGLQLNAAAAVGSITRPRKVWLEWLDAARVGRVAGRCVGGLSVFPLTTGRSSVTTFLVTTRRGGPRRG